MTMRALLLVMFLTSTGCEKNPFGGAASMGERFRPGLPPLPSVQQISPVEGSENGGTRIRLRGNNFSREIKVFFGSALCTEARIISKSEFECLTPPGPRGEINVIVQGAKGKRLVIENAFRYVSNISVTPGFAVSAGAGTMTSGNYRMEATLEAPPVRNTLEGNNFTMKANITFPSPAD